MDAFLVSQILAAIGFAVGLAAVQFKERRTVLLCLFALTLFNASHFFLLERTTAAVLMLLVGVRYVTAIFTTERPVLYFFLAVSVVSSAATFQGPSSLIALAAVLCGTYGSFQPTDRSLRIFLMLGNCGWLVHNLLVPTPVGIVMEASFLTSNLVGYWRFHGGARLRASEELRNPEASWQQEQAVPPLDRGEVESRFGPLEGPIELLSGGLANTNVRIGDGEVLRIYRRDVHAAAKERSLLQEEWQSFVTPRVLRSGDDYLVLEYVPHVPICTTDGRALGAALAEIHARKTFPSAGLLDANLALRQPFGRFQDAVAEHLEDLRAEVSHPAWRDLLNETSAWLRDLAGELEERASNPVLLHGDFKPSNLHKTAGGAPLVLDWEFAYAGPALMDVGQLLRWGVPSAFRDAFARGYREHGGAIDDEALAWAPAFDIINLAGLLGGSEVGTQRGKQLEAHLREALKTRPGS